MAKDSQVLAISHLAKTLAMKGDLEGAKEWLGAWAKQVSTSVNSHLQEGEGAPGVKEAERAEGGEGLQDRTAGDGQAGG